jgi:hypothetical protein
MNKRVIFLMLFLFLMPLISSVEISSNSEFSQGETFLAKISGNFFESPVKENILFYREYERVPVIVYLQEINEEFYVYGQLFGKQPGNYSMRIENVRYYNVNEIVDDDLRQNFTITENQSDFFIDPGFISANSDFSFTLQNLRNYEIRVSSKLMEESESSGGFFDSLFGGSSEETNLSSVNLKSGEQKKMNFNYENLSQGLNTIELSTENTIYNIPVFIFGPKASSGVQLEFKQAILNVTLPTSSNITKIVVISNKGESLKNVTVSVSDSLKPYVQIKNEKIDLNGSSEEDIEIVFTSGNEEIIIEGTLEAEAEEIFIDLPVFLNFVKDYVPPANGGGTLCSDLLGNLCTEGQECQGKLEFTSDGNCCIGSCVDKPKKNPYGIIIGWMLIVLVIAYALWFYLKKYRKVGKITDILKIATGKK